ncbi:MAG: hypothetical protein ACQKHC_02785 [Candidatus Phytoplasma pruni]|nr:hypothetical protein [Milkweed yellows phytoplasma]
MLPRKEECDKMIFIPYIDYKLGILARQDDECLNAAEKMLISIL